MGSHRAVGRLKGSVGGWFLNRAFDAIGEEALSPAVDQRGFAAFLYEEVTWPHVTFQFGGRVDHTQLRAERRARSRLHERLGLARPAVPAGRGRRSRDDCAQPGARGAQSGARGAVLLRPAPGQLRVRGRQPGPRVPSTRSASTSSLRWRSSRASGEVTYFRNDISDYVFRAPLTEEEFDSAPRRSSRPGSRTEASARSRLPTDEFPIVEYVAADSVLQGIEAHADFQVTSQLAVELGLDYVRGTLKDTDEPLPRIPPLRSAAGLRYQRNAFQAGGEVTAAATQDRLFSTETPTDGYQLLRLFASYSFGSGKVAQHDHGAARQRDQRAVSESSVAHQGPGRRRWAGTSSCSTT